VDLKRKKMNEQVKSLIEKEKERLAIAENLKRERHLRNLGLFDIKNIERVYTPNFNGAKFDSEKKSYYYEKGDKVVLDVTDSEYSEICKYFPPTSDDSTKEVRINYQGSGVKTLDSFGTFFFVIASISMLVALIGLIMYLANMDSYSGADNAMIGISMASTLFPTAIGSFAGGAICKGLSTIAKTALLKRALLEKQYKFVE